MSQGLSEEELVFPRPDQMPTRLNRQDLQTKQIAKHGPDMIKRSEEHSMHKAQTQAATCKIMPEVNPKVPGVSQGNSLKPSTHKHGSEASTVVNDFMCFTASINALIGAFGSTERRSASSSSSASLLHGRGRSINLSRLGPPSFPALAVNLCTLFCPAAILSSAGGYDAVRGTSLGN
eukprot:CAMPEP_0194783262 /NCGR_PEP_ID=MMETSP0323_2-20130528/79128_1 /TAXON_ID=2866 ORGANISM="Crypthecodinium cohnii, Strain Seligo" /NCGR_SAMPLE_ID=MMETSP0323_2 /ASSEMBLY_ACC=CAM_ASM_000346 /LENGTH=176 /DNA_ID=CAMNT_0039722127 /DNA_START=478 /DNA_END=1008 /DNA_ORIENTATION=-